MWQYKQSTGELLHNDTLVDTGYSGAGESKNNPDAERLHDMGPLPRGEWSIEGPPYDTTKHGPYVLRLEPKPGTDTFTRAGFLIHGDSVKAPGTASQGCIIMPRATRERVWNSGDADLEVVS